MPPTKSLRLRSVEAAALSLTGILASASCGGSDDLPSPELPPARNVVVYLVDTLRADHLGTYGYARETSPRLDAFGEEGLVFEHCVAQSTWTKPASASVLTGIHPSEHGMLSEESVLPEDVVTLARRISDAGLSTGAFVTNQQVSRKKADLLRGFEEPRPMYNPGGDPPYVRAEDVVDSLLEWIEGLEDERFFAYVHTVDPHAPYSPPPPFDERFTDPDASELDGSYVLHASQAQYDRLGEADVQRLVDLYDGEVAYTDQQFGRFLDGLERLGLADDTLVVFLSDHGEAFGEHDHWGHHPFMYREVIRVPLLLRFPRGSALVQGRRADVCSQVDVAPTVLDALGLPFELPDLPGRSLLRPPPDVVPPAFTEVEGGISRKAIVTDEHKYVRQWSPTATELLFDLGADPGEDEDLSESPAVEPYRRMLDAFVAETSSGYSLLFQNGRDDWMVVDCRIESSTPLERVKLFYADTKARHGDRRDGPPVVTDDDGGSVVECRFHVKAKDGDGIRFDPGPDASLLRIDVTIDGEPLDPRHVRLGATDAPVEGPPIVVDLASGMDLAAPRPAAREDVGGAPYRVTFWRPLSLTADTEELSEDEQAALRALGYLGED